MHTRSERARVVYKWDNQHEVPNTPPSQTLRARNIDASRTAKVNLSAVGSIFRRLMNCFRGVFCCTLCHFHPPLWHHSLIFCHASSPQNRFQNTFHVGK